MKYIILAIVFIFICIASQAETINLTTRNTVTFRGVVNETSVTHAQRNLIEAVRKRKGGTYPIYLVMDSPGGSIGAGNSFVEFAKGIDNLHTISIFAASMASAIVEHLPGKRYATSNVTMMFHRARATISGQFESGEMESRLAFIKTMVRSMEYKNAQRMGMSLSHYKGLVLNEWWIYGSDSVKYKVVDAIVDLRCSRQLAEKRITSKFQSFFGSFKLKYSACPLLRYPQFSK